MRVVVTNNPQVRDYISVQKLDRYYELVWINGYTEDVLRCVRDLCHKHYRLITHPLTGSIKPNHTPYKTTVLERIASPEVDFESVMLAETSLAKTLFLLADRPRPKAAFEHLSDFSVIDLDFFKSYLSGATNYPG